MSLIFNTECESALTCVSMRVHVRVRTCVSVHHKATKAYSRIWERDCYCRDVSSAQNQVVPHVETSAFVAYLERTLRIPHDEIGVISDFNGAFPVSHAAQRRRFHAEQPCNVTERQINLLRMRPEQGQP